MPMSILMMLGPAGEGFLGASWLGEKAEVGRCAWSWERRAGFVPLELRPVAVEIIFNWEDLRWVSQDRGVAIHGFLW